MSEIRQVPGWGLLVRRTGAFLIDVALLFVVLAPLGFLLQHALEFTPATSQQIWVALVVNFSLPTWLYFAISDTSEHGATLGKRWLRVPGTRGWQAHHRGTRSRPYCIQAAALGARSCVPVRDGR
jgi:hypothetical protein